MSQDPIQSVALPTGEPKATGASQNNTDVYAIHGADPEVLAYAMAKYSRSSLSMRESLAEIDSQRAEQFLNTFYFQYGHRSIADLAHIPFAIERLSLLAAITLVDEQRWDGQERSTRYQDFRKSGWYTPQFGEATPVFTAAVEAAFAAYDGISQGMLQALKTAIARPDAMKPDAYERAVKARAFDVARYLLPLATNTSLGQIVNARTLETQVSRLLTSEFAEIRDIAEKLRIAASEPAWNVQHAALQPLLDDLSQKDPIAAKGLGDRVLRQVKTAPTLVKYANPSEYASASRMELRAAASELMGNKGHRRRSCSRSDRRWRVARGRDCLLAALSALSLPLSPDSLRGRRLERCEEGRTRCPWRGPSRAPRRAAATIPRRARVPLRHPHGHWRLPRHAPPSPLRSTAAGVH